MPRRCVLLYLIQNENSLGFIPTRAGSASFQHVTPSKAPDRFANQTMSFAPHQSGFWYHSPI